MTERMHFDGVLIVGAGLAGLSAALAAAPRRALVLAPGALTWSTASAWAQGGIAAALAEDDDPADHAADTIAAGAGLVDPAMAALMAEEGPAAVRWLAELGAPFDRDAAGRFVQSLEAAHGHARVARVKGDQAGLAIMRAIAKATFAASHVEIREGARALSLIQDGEGRIRGVLAEIAGRTVEIMAPAVVLATGGVGGLYAVTTNPPQALGEGLAMAAIAGACIGDPEFVQFHPTAIDVGRDPAPLATEALRGEGARLIDAQGRPFMAAYHEMAELAPRDVVARAIHRQIQSGEGAFLDARTAVGAAFPHEFPTVFAACMDAGLDPRTQPIPVAPAAHYIMGGIVTDADARTTLDGLYAAGECASTGVHGANRLASNSLLEAVVFGRRAGAAAGQATRIETLGAKAMDVSTLPSERLQRLRKVMAADVGVMRDRAGLGRALDHIVQLEREFGKAAPLTAARLIAENALRRNESRGAHYRSDFPCMASPARRTFVTMAEAQQPAPRNKAFA